MRLRGLCAQMALPWEGVVEECHLFTPEGRVAGRRREPPPGEPGILDLRGEPLVALPGLIDMHVHLRGLRLRYKETVATGTRAAARGGLAVVVDMPNTSPRLDTPGAVEARLREVEREAAVDVYLYAGIPRRPGLAAQLAGMPRVVGFKAYPGDLERPRLLREAASTGLPIVLHPELPLAERIPDPLDARERSALRPCWLEAAAPGLLREALGPGARIHVTHASCPGTLREARRAGATVDVAPHHLVYDYTVHTGCTGRVNPPLRGPVERSILLREAIAGLAVDALASDHAPHHPREKTGPACRPGYPWLELWPSLAYTLLEAAHGPRRAPLLLAGLAYEAPRRILGLPSHARPGGLGSYTVLRRTHTHYPGDQWTLAPRWIHLGLELRAEAAATIVRGRLAYRG